MSVASAGNVSQSIEALNQILQTASSESIEQAEKMVKATLEIALGTEAGKGAQFDVTA